MKVRLICIKEIKELEDCDSPLIERFIQYFKVGNIYKFDITFEFIEKEIKDRWLFSYNDDENDFAFHKDEIDEYFMTLEQWRELRINKLLNES